MSPNPNSDPLNVLNDVPNLRKTQLNDNFVSFFNHQLWQQQQARSPASAVENRNWELTQLGTKVHCNLREEDLEQALRILSPILSQDVVSFKVVDYVGMSEVEKFAKRQLEASEQRLIDFKSTSNDSQADAEQLLQLERDVSKYERMMHQGDRLKKGAQITFYVPPGMEREFQKTMKKIADVLAHHHLAEGEILVNSTTGELSDIPIYNNLSARNDKSPAGTYVAAGKQSAWPEDIDFPFEMEGTQIANHPLIQRQALTNFVNAVMDYQEQAKFLPKQTVELLNNNHLTAPEKAWMIINEADRYLPNESMKNPQLIALKADLSTIQSGKPLDNQAIKLLNVNTGRINASSESLIDKNRTTPVQTEEKANQSKKQQIIQAFKSVIHKIRNDKPAPGNAREESPSSKITPK